jgi:periplasmic protein CpxP/Spy
VLKSATLAVVLTALLFAIVSLAVAEEGQAGDRQTVPSTQHEDYGRGRHEGMDPTKRTQTLTKQLKLTPDQQAKVHGILQEEQTSIENLRQDSSLSQQDRRANMTQIRNTANDQIRALLTGDQREKWEEIQKSREQRGWGHHRGLVEDEGVNPQSPDRS